MTVEYIEIEDIEHIELSSESNYILLNSSLLCMAINFYIGVY